MDSAFASANSQWHRKQTSFSSRECHHLRNAFSVFVRPRNRLREVKVLGQCVYNQEGMRIGQATGNGMEKKYTLFLRGWQGGKSRVE